METKSDKKTDSKNKEEQSMSEISNQIAQKIVEIQKKKRKRRFGFKMNPLWLLIILAVFSYFTFAFFSNNANSNSTISLDEFVKNASLESNRYSVVSVQNNERVLVEEKYYYTISGAAVFDSSEDGIDNVKKTSEVVSVDFFEDYQNLSTLQRLRNALGQSSSKIDTILIGEDFSVAIDTKEFSEVVYISDLNKSNLDERVQELGISLSDLNLQIHDLKIFSRELDFSSLDTRLGTGEISGVVDLSEEQNISIAIRNTDKIETFEIPWTQNYVTFISDVLDANNLSLSAGNFSVVSLNIAPGITFSDILTLLTVIGFIVVAIMLFRGAQSSGMGIMQFGQSKARMFFGQKPDVTFADVAGIDEAKEELSEIVDFLKNPAKFRKMGARIPKGILMYGPPGTGKTLLARAIAGEAGVPFFHTSGSEFEEMLVGAGASRVRDLFAKAKKAAPALIFIDEIDAVARKRGTRIQSGSTEQTLNQILVEMDGFEKNVNVIVIAATNRPDVLDDAILRPGRFDRQVQIDFPDREGRFQILKIHSENKPLAKTVDLNKIAARTVGFTGADLENIMNESAIIAAKEGTKDISMKQIDEAVSKVILGPAKKSKKRTENELKLVAYHEAGHALIAKLTDNSIPVDKISIVSRGNSGGVTMFIPEKDENIVSKSRLLADIKVSLGGRAAEEVALDDISTGASNDIEKATKVAKSMIQKFGMSKDLGMVRYGSSMDSEHLGYAYGDSRDFSESTAQKIDDEVRQIINNLYKEAVELLKQNRAKLDEIANKLLEVEVLDKEDFERMFEK